MEFHKAVRAATKNLLRSEAARTYKVASWSWGEKETYVLEISPDVCNPAYLNVETWGFDYAGFGIPQFRTSLIRRKMHLQMKMADGLDGVEQVEFRYLMDILRRESN